MTRDRRSLLVRGAGTLGDGRKALWAAIVVGLLVRVVAMVAFGVGNSPLYEFGIIGHNADAGRGYSFYAVQGGRVAVDETHAGRPLPSAFMPPGYTATVAVSLRMSASEDGARRLLQIINLAAAAAGIALIWQLGRRVMSREAAGLAAVGYALFPALIYQVTQASASNLYIPLELLVMLTLVTALDRPSVLRAAQSGLALGVLCLFRSEALVLIPLAVAWLWWWLRGAGRDPAKMAAGLLIPALLVPGAWIARNTIVLNRFTPTITTSGGFNLWVGNHAGATGSEKKFAPESSQLRQALAKLPQDATYESGRDRLYLNDALRNMSQHPGETLLRDTKKLVLTVTADTYDARSHNALYLAAWALLVILGVLGMRSPPLRRPAASLLYGQLAFSVLIPVVFFALDRYKLSIELVLILFGANWLADRLAQHADLWSTRHTRLAQPARPPG